MIDSNSPSVLVRVWLLGTFQVQRRTEDGTWETLDKARWEKSYARPLFKRLLCASGRRAQRITLIDDLWPDPEHPELVERYLNDASYHLRKVLGTPELLQTFGHASGYQLAHQSHIWTDVDECTALMTEVENIRRTSAPALRFLEQAQALFERGDVLEGEAGLWCHAKRGVVERLRYRCQLWLAEAYEQQGLVGQAEMQYSRLFEDNPLDEDVLCRLMGLLHRQGMTQQALRCYNETKEHFKQDGLQLSPATDVFAKRLFNEPRQIELYVAHERLASPLWEGNGQQVELPQPPTMTQSIIREAYMLGSQDIHSMLRRQFLQQIFGMTGAAFFVPGLTQWKWIGHNPITDSTEEFLSQCEANILACWRLMKGSEILVVRSVLTAWLPPLSMLVEQPSKHQKKLATLAAQGYILAGLVAVLQRRYDGAEWCCRQAVEYSRLAEDDNLLVASLKHLATKYNSAKYALLTLRTYQEALPLVIHASPLLCSRIYLGLALSSAQCQQKHEAEHYFGLAQDTFPEHPEDDPSFLYADCGRSSLNHYGGLIHLEFNQPKQAWETFAGVEELKSKILIPERTIIEIINCQAEAALAQRNMELACAHVQAGVAGALKLNSEKRFYDTLSTYKKMCSIWSHEQKVKQLEELFHQGAKS